MPKTGCTRRTLLLIRFTHPAAMAWYMPAATCIFGPATPIACQLQAPGAARRPWSKNIWSRPLVQTTMETTGEAFCCTPHKSAPSIILLSELSTPSRQHLPAIVIAFASWQTWHSSDACTSRRTFESRDFKRKHARSVVALASLRRDRNQPNARAYNNGHACPSVSQPCCRPQAWHQILQLPAHCWSCAQLTYRSGVS